MAATIQDRRMVFVLTYEGLVSLDPANGNVFFEIPFWPTGVDTINATSPMVVGDRVFIASGPGPGCRLYRISPNGQPEELWRDRRALDSQFNNLAALNGFLYGFTSKWNGGATFNCLDLDTGEVKWKFPSDLVRGSFLAVEDHFLLWGEYGHLAVMRINPEKPDLISITPSPLLRSPCYSAPALHKGLLYLRNERTLLCLNLRTDGP
jgi:outer membrane protein assembly factor BamB